MVWLFRVATLVIATLPFMRLVLLMTRANGLAGEGTLAGEGDGTAGEGEKKISVLKDDKMHLR